MCIQDLLFPMLTLRTIKNVQELSLKGEDPNPTMTANLSFYTLPKLALSSFFVENPTKFVLASPFNHIRTFYWSNMINTRKLLAI